MSEFKSYKTKWLKIDLYQNHKDIIVKNCAPLRQKSLDKKIIKERIVPQFPARMGSTTNSLSSEGSHDNDLAFKYVLKDLRDESTKNCSIDSQAKTYLLTNDASSSLEKSSENSKQMTLLDFNSSSQMVSLYFYCCLSLTRSKLQIYILY